MTISIWRYSHLALAVSSFLFIALASVTGIILAFEPVSQKVQPYRVEHFSSLSLAQALNTLKETDSEITDLTVDPNQFVVLKCIDSDGKNTAFYTDPETGKPLGAVSKKNEFFQWVTTLHRSLFLHETGRFFVGLTAFLLLLIATSGTVLIIQRQRGVKRFFTKIVRENFAQYYHVLLGRLLLIPILLITITGTYLSLVRFEVFTEKKISHKIDFDSIKTEPKKKLDEFAVFKNTPLSEVQSIEFPFSEDPEDYYTIKLKDREIVVNQITGDILSEIRYSTITQLTSLSLDLHTGRASILWAMVLAVAAINILFFIYSGFAMTLKRISGKVKNKYKKEDCEFILLVGSENGSTFRFAKAIYQQLIKNGQSCYLTELNNYTVFPNAKHLIILTATYGLGDAPTNAKKFAALLKNNPQHQSIDFSVLGFGSHAYPDFCQFAYEANNLLSLEQWAIPFMEIHTVSDKSPDECNQWAQLWSQKTQIPLTLPPELFDNMPKSLQSFQVITKTTPTDIDGAFLIRLKPKRGLKFTSGDLLAIYPQNDHRERLYSIGKIEKDIQLSVKIHLNGLGSGYLNQLQSDTSISARIISNPHFHLPKKASAVIMISNGTGIAPFLGMIDQNYKKVPCHLYCGFRGLSSFELYKESIHKNIGYEKLSQLHIAYSRESGKQYVKDLLFHDAAFVTETLKNKGVIMICGSLSMQQNVIELLESICQSNNGKGVSFYQAHNQILMDCY